MIISTFNKQFRVLLWKNFTLKIRRPLSTMFEILIPISVVVIIMLIRNLQSNSRMDQCNLREKYMDSMGPLLFLRDVICTLNSTCYNQSQMNWNITNENDFQTFITNVSSLYIIQNSNRLNIANITNFNFWIEYFPSEMNRLKNTILYFNNQLLPLLKAVGMVSSSDPNVSTQGFITLSDSVCGSKNNDAQLFASLFLNNINVRTKRSIQTCKEKLDQYYSTSTALQWQMFQLIKPLIFGKIYYTPDSAFTRELVTKANLSFVILDQLRLTSIEWRLHFKEWLEIEITNGSSVNDLRNAVHYCVLYNVSGMASDCRMISNFVTVTNLKSIISDVTVLFSLTESILNCVELNKFVPVKSPIIIDSFESTMMPDVFGALIFDQSYDNVTLLNYTIRISQSRIDTTVGFKTLDKFWTPIPRRKMFQDLKYYTSGFIMLQEAVDRAFIEMVTVQGNVNIGSSMQLMPSPCYVYNGFITFATSTMPFMFLVAWLPSFVVLVKSIVYEKEKRLKEFMLVMGLSHSVLWLAWFTVALLMTLIPMIVIVLVLFYTAILEFSSPGIVFLLFVSYSIAFICQAFMFAVFFNKANVAAVVAAILYFTLYIPALIFINMPDSIPVIGYIITGILSQVSFCNALTFISYWEQTTEGAQFSNLFDSTVLNLNVGVGHCIIMLWVDAIVYLAVTLYVEAVFPGQYGVPKPWYFFVTRRYWWPRKSATPVTIINNTHSSANFETVSEDLKIGISIRNLTKTFSSSKVASVDNLSVDFYESQITAFLGHNGAGKTTTISMLTGMVPPSAGTAYVFNDDIRTEIDTIRQRLSLCPQHNILFDHLTVADHIYFYGVLRGMSPDDVRLTMPTIVDDVGLTTKIKTQSRHLSGGMKRKLSVALAFIGDSKAIFLDEPTAGVDPFARRGIWDLLMKYRAADKVIVLTTHHMDEADYLSDRIAIIAQGRLKCCGSSVFLKRQFGDGYYLTAVKCSETAARSTQTITQSSDAAMSATADTLLTFVRRHIHDAIFLEESGTEVTVILPTRTSSNDRFSAMFRDLDDSLDSLSISSYGLSDTSLEDVFLKVADDPSKSEGKDPSDVVTLSTDSGNLPRPKTRFSFRDRRRIYTVTNPTKGTDQEALLSGWALLCQQILALQIKKFHYTKRNVKGLFCELILPLAMVILLVGLLKMINPFEQPPRMVIHPWLMMPAARRTDLNTFYRRENVTNDDIDRLTNLYRSDLGESGFRCMDKSVYTLDNLPCYSTSGNSWSAVPQGEIPMQSPSCDCNATGFQLCTNPLSGGPPNSHRTMASSDILHNLTGYNISDHLIKKFKKYAKKQYGGYQFLLPSYFGIACQMIANNSLWNGLRSYNAAINSSNSRPNISNFLDYFQTFFQLSGIRTNFTRIWINSKGYVAMPAYSNIFDNLLLRSRLKPSEDPTKYGIVVSSHPFKYSQLDLFGFINTQMYLEISLAIFVILALSIIPASFVLFLIEERVTGSKRLQFVSGVNPYVYWVSNFVGDLLKYLVSASFVAVIFVVFNNETYVGNKNVSVFLLFLYLYGLVIIPHMYPFSFFISTPSTAFVIVSVYNMILGSMTTTIIFYLDGIKETYPNSVAINNALRYIFLLFPQYSLGRGMMELSFKYFSYSISNGTENYNPYDMDITGQKLIALGSLFLFWCSVVVIIESRIINRVIGFIIKTWKLTNCDFVCNEDTGVVYERNRIKSDQSNSDILKVSNLTKVYNMKMKCHGDKRKVAVNAISFGVRAGECFGLLGVNGAGKTTTFKMLTGEEPITSGDAIINGKSIIRNMVAAHQNMGFCPQVDALHPLLTCEEELYFYCRIRGIRSELIKSTVESSVKNLSLIPYTNKTTKSLSGGNKRKLSTAISLIGSSKVIFMDEPTSGMDAGARRFLWNQIQKLTSEGRAVVLTSHNMEECEVLCHRLAIMVNGRFKCLGSVQQLKSKFGDDYYVTVRHNSYDHSFDSKIKDLVFNEFRDGVMLKDENMVTMEFAINLVRFKLDRIFHFFDSLKWTGRILDFSISQATLDDIFINFAKTDGLISTVSLITNETGCYDNLTFETT